MQSEGPESTNRRRLEAYDGRSSGDKCEAQGVRAQRGEDLRPMTAVGWQPTARVARTHPTRIDWVKA